MLPCPLCGDEFPPEASFCPNDKTPRPTSDSYNEVEFEEMIVEPTHVSLYTPVGNEIWPKFQVEPGVVIGEYVLEAKIGEGGMGEIWRGSQPLIGKQVAIKILRHRVAEDKASIGRFIQEAKVVNSIKHKGLIDIFSFGDLPDNRPYFVMEFLEGRSLSAYLSEKGPLPWSEMLEILAQTCGALGATHQRGIIHRDLKSENLFLLFDENKKLSSVKLLDFGIAKLVSPDDENAALTQAGDIFGTPAYMSPEQCQGAATHQSDIYSLGIIWYEMITGRTPFYEPGEKVANVLVRQMSEIALPPSTLVAGREVPSEIDDLVLQILSKEPEERPSSCGELAKEIHALLTPLAAKEVPLPSTAKPIYSPTLKGKRPPLTPPPNKSSAVLLVAIFSFLVIGASTFYLLFTAQPATGSPVAVAPKLTPVVSTSASTSTSTPSTTGIATTEPQHPLKVTLTVNTTPNGAEVFLGESLLGISPLVYELDYSEVSIELILKKDGYKPYEIQFIPKANNNFSQALISDKPHSLKKIKDPKSKNQNLDPNALAPLKKQF
jgi:eukaryotic-like serine/threonine-protein kinase